MIILVKTEQTLQTGYINPLGGKSEPITMEILFDLTFIYKDHDISNFEGEWIDVNNVIYRIVAVNGTVADKHYLQQERMLKDAGNFRSKVQVKKP